MVGRVRLDPMLFIWFELSLSDVQRPDISNAALARSTKV